MKIRSLCDGNNTKIGKIKDIFQNCSGQLPDLLAFSDTQVKDSSPIPSLDGFHDFEFTPTPTGAGGVGFYLSETLNYVLCPDLKLKGMKLCEDIWLKVTNISFHFIFTGFYLVFHKENDKVTMKRKTDIMTRNKAAFL